MEREGSRNEGVISLYGRAPPRLLRGWDKGNKQTLELGKREGKRALSCSVFESLLSQLCTTAIQDHLEVLKKLIWPGNKIPLTYFTVRKK